MQQLISSGKNLTYEHKKKCQPIESDGHKHTNWEQGISDMPDIHC